MTLIEDKTPLLFVPNAAAPGPGLPPASSLAGLALHGDAYALILDRVDDGIYMADSAKRVQFWNAAAEAITGFSRAEVIGKACGSRLLCHVDAEGKSLCETSCPLDCGNTTPTLFEGDAFLQHKLGYRIPVHMKTWPLRDPQGHVVGTVEIFHSKPVDQHHARLIEELSHLALIDDLTRLPNRLHFDIQLDRRQAELNRFGWPFGVMMLDLDHFKRVNDTFGHQIGDQVLHLVARTLSSNCRSLDTIARWGGEEFAAIIANVREDELRKVAEKFRAMVEASGLRACADVPVSVTVSIGGAMAKPNEPAADLMKRADEMLYAAKRGGRNCVRI